MKILFMFLFLSNLLMAGTIIKDKYKWKKESIKVCWWDYNTPLLKSLKKIDPELYSVLITKYFKAQISTQSRKEIIKSAIQKSFNKKELGIEYIGWKNCSNDFSKNDVIIYALSGFKYIGPEGLSPRNSSHLRYENKIIKKYYNNRSGRSSISLYDANGIKSEPQSHLILLDNHDSINQYTSDYLRLNAIHEFGHLSGLRHEHIRYQDSLIDPLCHTMKYSIIEHSDEPAKEEVTDFTSRYDQNSIMSYCLYVNYTHISYLIKNKALYDLERHSSKVHEAISVNCELTEANCLTKLTKLSKADKHAIKCLYKYEKIQKNDLCHKDFDLEEL